MERHIFQPSRDPKNLMCALCNEFGPHTNHTSFPVDDPVNPSHYTFTSMSAVAVSEEWGLNFRLFSVLKYLQRHERKGDPLENLKKAKWYLDREIAKREGSLG